MLVNVLNTGPWCRNHSINSSKCLSRTYLAVFYGVVDGVGDGVSGGSGGVCVVVVGTGHLKKRFVIVVGNFLQYFLQVLLVYRVLVKICSISIIGGNNDSPELRMLRYM